MAAKTLHTTEFLAIQSPAGTEALKTLLEQGIARSHKAKMKALRIGATGARKEAEAKQEVYTEVYDFVMKVIS